MMMATSVSGQMLAIGDRLLLGIGTAQNQSLGRVEGINKWIGCARFY